MPHPVPAFLATMMVALTACASTDERDGASYKTALVDNKRQMAIQQVADPVSTMITGSTEREDMVQLESIHSHIAPQMDSSAKVHTIAFDPASGKPLSPLAGRTIYLDQTQDIQLYPKEVVLSFDDGPVPHNTPAVLDAMKAHGVKGLFFMVGEMAHYHPEVAARVVAEGHTIGSHTYSHPNLVTLSLDKALADIDHGAFVVDQTTGTKTHFFRFPYLSENEKLDQALVERDYIPVGVDIDSLDYMPADTNRLVSRIMLGLEQHGGGIILMHDLQRRTAKAIGPLLNRLKDEGYKVVQLKYGKAPDEPLYADTLLNRLRFGSGTAPDKVPFKAPDKA